MRIKLARDSRRTDRQETASSLYERRCREVCRDDVLVFYHDRVCNWPDDSRSLYHGVHGETPNPARLDVDVPLARLVVAFHKGLKPFGPPIIVF